MLISLAEKQIVLIEHLICSECTKIEGYMKRYDEYIKSGIYTVEYQRQLISEQKNMYKELLTAQETLRLVQLSKDIMMR